MKKLLLLLIIPMLGFSQNIHCGDRPLKPEKVKNETNKQYKNSTKYVSYKKKMKEWKYCVSPMGIADRIDENLEKKSITETANIINPCGDKPKKPTRNEGLNHEEYRQTAEHIEYRQKLKDWRMCVKKSN